MAGTPEEDLLGWLEREEERLGFTNIDDALGDIKKAQSLFYEELGYNMTDDQFAGMKDASYLRYDELPSIGMSTSTFEREWGVQRTYRDITTGRFVKAEDVFSLLATVR